MSDRDLPDPSELIPDSTNLFGTIDTALTHEKVAAVFAAAGWTTRRSGFDEFMLESPFAELILEGDQKSLLHGPVANLLVNAQRIADILRQAKLPFSLECYSETG